MNKRMSLTWIICAPLFIVFVLAASIFQQYLYALNQEIDDAYADIQQQLERAEKVVTALDYTFTHNQRSAENILFVARREKWAFETTKMSTGYSAHFIRLKRDLNRPYRPRSTNDRGDPMLISGGVISQLASVLSPI